MLWRWRRLMKSEENEVWYTPTWNASHLWRVQNFDLWCVSILISITSLVVPMGSPSCGRDVPVGFAFMGWGHYCNLTSLPTPFIVLFVAVYGPFNCILLHKFTPWLPTFLIECNGFTEIRTKWFWAKIFIFTVSKCQPGKSFWEWLVCSMKFEW